MKRKAEKHVLLAAAIWNILNAAITILGYSGWFREEGIRVFEKGNEYSYLSASLLDSLVQVVMIYGLIVLAVGVVNIFVSRFMENRLIDRRVMI